MFKMLAKYKKFIKVDLQNLLEQFPHISTTNIAALFLSEHFKRGNDNF